MKNNYSKFLVTFIFSLCLTECIGTLEGKTLSIMGGGGPWFGDDTKTSLSFGGGLIVDPGLEFMELVLSYDRTPVKLKAADRLAPSLKGDSLNHFRGGFTFPIELTVFQKIGHLFPMVAYTLVTNESKTAHGFALGGGLSMPIYSDWLKIRFEALNQIYKIPTRTGGSTNVQQDFFINTRLVFEVF